MDFNEVSQMDDRLFDEVEKDWWFKATEGAVNWLVRTSPRKGETSNAVSVHGPDKGCVTTILNHQTVLVESSAHRNRRRHVETVTDAKSTRNYFVAVLVLITVLLVWLAGTPPLETIFGGLSLVVLSFLLPLFARARANWVYGPITKD